MAGEAMGRTITPELARHIIGLGLKASQRLLFPDLERPDPEFLSAFHAAYRKTYEDGEDEIPLYDGAFELVASLSRAGDTVAVATAKSRAGINRSLAKTGLDAFIRHSRTPEECRPKPDPQMIRELIAETGFSADRTIMVGDTTHDLQMAINAGVKAIGISHGAHSHAELAALDVSAVCRSIAELNQIFL